MVWATRANPAFASICRTHDKAGNIRAVVNPLGNRTSHAFEKLDRVTAVIGAIGPGRPGGLFPQRDRPFAPPPDCSGGSRRRIKRRPRLSHRVPKYAALEVAGSTAWLGLKATEPSGKAACELNGLKNRIAVPLISVRAPVQANW